MPSTVAPVELILLVASTFKLVDSKVTHGLHVIHNISLTPRAGRYDFLLCLCRGKRPVSACSDRIWYSWSRPSFFLLHNLDNLIALDIFQALAMYRGSGKSLIYVSLIRTKSLESTLCDEEGWYLQGSAYFFNATSNVPDNYLV